LRSPAGICATASAQAKPRASGRATGPATKPCAHASQKARTRVKVQNLKPRLGYSLRLAGLLRKTLRTRQALGAGQALPHERRLKTAQPTAAP
jgi:hypothetical protein